MRRFIPAFFLAVLFSSSLALAGTIDFFEGNNGKQDKIGTVSDESGRGYNLKDEGAPVKDDEARSVVLNVIKAGTTITVYDDAKGREGKSDYCIIEVLKDVQQYTVSSFERTYTDESVRVTYSKEGGLDGKVSHIRVEKK